MLQGSSAVPLDPFPCTLPTTHSRKRVSPSLHCITSTSAAAASIKTTFPTSTTTSIHTNPMDSDFPQQEPGLPLSQAHLQHPYKFKCGGAGTSFHHAMKHSSTFRFLKHQYPWLSMQQSVYRAPSSFQLLRCLPYTTSTNLVSHNSQICLLRTEQEQNWITSCY